MVGDEAELPGGDAVDLDPPLQEFFRQGPDDLVGALDGEEHHVDLDAVGLDLDAGYLGDALPEPGGVLVVCLQLPRHLGEGQDAGGGQDAALAHGAAQDLPVLPGPGDKLPAPRQHRANRGAEALGKAEHYRIGVFCHLGGGDPPGHGGVKEPGPVHMHHQAAGLGGGVDGLHLLQGDHPAGGQGVLHAEEGGGGTVEVILPDGLFQQMGVDDIVRAVHRVQGHPGQDSGGPYLVDQDVGVAAADDGVPPPGVGHDGQLVAHGAGGDKKGGFLAGKLRRQLLQAVDGGVVTIDIVPHRGLGHGPAHLRGGLGDGVAADIDDTVHHK